MMENASWKMKRQDGMRALLNKLPFSKQAKGFVARAYYRGYGMLFPKSAFYQTWCLMKDSKDKIRRRLENGGVQDSVKTQQYVNFNSHKDCSQNLDSVKMLVFYLLSKAENSSWLEFEEKVEYSKKYGVSGFCLEIKLAKDFYEALNVVNHLPNHFEFCFCIHSSVFYNMLEKREQECFNVLKMCIQDNQYLKKKNKPIILIKDEALDNMLLQNIQTWNQFFGDSGLGEAYLILYTDLSRKVPQDGIFDAVLDLQTIEDPDDYESIVYQKSYLQRGMNQKKFQKVCLPSSTTKHYLNYDYYKEWLIDAIKDTRYQLEKDERFIFVSAWNDWEAGIHLDPSSKTGYSNLQYTAEAIVAAHKALGGIIEPSNQKLITIVAPSYNHEKYIEQSLRSIATQMYINKELIIIDDCSKDNTPKIIRELIQTEEFIVAFPGGIRFIEHKTNEGAHSSINEGLLAASGEYLSIINTDDLYEVGRLELMAYELEAANSELAFSKICTIDENNRKGNYPNLRYFRDLQRHVELRGNTSMSELFSWGNPAISTGNLLFTKKLYMEIGEFKHYQYNHDWDFVLRAILVTEPIFVENTYYFYRIHSENTFSLLSKDPELCNREVNAVTSNYFKRIQTGKYKNPCIPGGQGIERYIIETLQNPDLLYMWLKAKDVELEGE